MVKKRPNLSSNTVWTNICIPVACVLPVCWPCPVVYRGWCPPWRCMCPGGVQGGCVSRGCVSRSGCVQEVYLSMQWGRHPPMNRMTDRCKNITLPQISFAGGNNDPLVDSPCFKVSKFLYSEVQVEEVPCTGGQGPVYREKATPPKIGEGSSFTGTKLLPLNSQRQRPLPLHYSP